MRLTPRQDALYAILCDNEAESYVALSYKEMGTLVGGITGPAVLFLLRGLEERGYIRRTPGKMRSIEVIVRGLCPHCHLSIGSEACRAAATSTITYSLTPTQPARAA